MEFIRNSLTVKAEMNRLGRALTVREFPIVGYQGAPHLCGGKTARLLTERSF